MKKNNFRHALLIVMLVFTFSNCDKKLEQINPNQQTTLSYWQNADDALKGVTAAYSSLIIDGGYLRFLPALNDIRGDDVRSNSPWTAFGNIGKFTLGTSDPAGYGWTFDALYQGVSRSNQVIEKVPAITMNDDLKKRVLGQAYFLRGLYFFNLVNLYGNVGLPTKVPASSADFYAPQQTTEAGWNQVISDFTAAADMLPVSYATVSGLDANQIGRATKGAALAFLGKSYLFNKKFTEAAAQFKAIIDLGVYDLVPNYRDNFTTANENNIESLFEIQFSESAGGTDIGWGGEPASGWAKITSRARDYGPRGFGFCDVQPTFSVFEEFKQEKTVSSDVDPRLDATIFYNKPGDFPMYKTTFQTAYASSPANLNDIFWRKYENSDGDRDAEGWPSGINERIMRYADVLLMYAECLNELGQTLDAYPFIQKVRSRVNLPELATVKPNMTQAEMRDQLAHERLLEFCGEGHRFDDIRRWGWLQDAAKLVTLKVRDPEFESYKPGREVFPIPLTEIDNNPGYLQNPTY